MTVLGRGRAHRRLAAMEARARSGRAASVLFVGAAGVGKTALLESLARSSTGASVLVTGADRRLGRAPAGVAGLLALPLLRLPLPQSARGALDRLWDDGDCPPDVAADAILACVAVAGRSPVVHLVDDLDELDAPGRATVTALVAKATTEPLVVVATSREPVAGWTAAQARLRPLPDDVIRELLVHERVHPRVVEELLPLVAGIPSAAHTLLAALTPDERAGMDRLPGELPPDPRLVAAAGAEIQDLDEEAQRRVLARALGAGDRRRALVLAAAAPALRRQAHAAVAATTEGPPGLLHRAAASEGSDDSLASELVTAADLRLEDRDLAGATELLVAAGSIAAAPALRGQSWYRAATASYLTGQNRLALDLVGNLRALPTSDADAFGLHRLEALAGLHVDGADAVIERLVPAAERAADAGDPVAARSLLLIAGVYSLYACRVEDLADFAGRAAALPADDPLAAATVTLFSASADLYARADATVVRQLAPLLVGLLDIPTPAEPLPDLDLDPSRSQFFAALLLLTDEHWQPARALLERVWTHDRDAGWTGAQGLDAAWYALALWRTGDWSEALDVARSTVSDGALGRSRVWVEAFLAGAELLVGRPDEAARHRAVVEADATSPSRIPLVELLMRSGTGVGLLGVGDAAGALEHLSVAAALAGHVHPGLVWWRADLVEALAATGQSAAARAEATAFGDLVGDDAAPVLRGRVLRAHGLAATGRRSLDRLARAVEVHESGECPFELARSLLALAEARWAAGEDDSVAADPARRAHELFVGLGAEGFAARAAAVGAGATEAPSLAGLSPREREVADLVAAGATNNRVASELGVSASTVSFHLESIFRKLRITSRTQLASVLRDH